VRDGLTVRLADATVLVAASDAVWNIKAKQMNRREFLIKTGTAATGFVLGGALSGRAQTASPTSDRVAGSVAIICDPNDPVVAAKPAQWAVEQLRHALTTRSVVVKICERLEEAPPNSLCIVASAVSSSLVRDTGVVPPAEAEVLSLVAGRLGQHETLIASGSDSRGLSYALTELADAVAFATDPWAPLRPALPLLERPANRVRSVMRVFASDVEDKAWFNDRDFWRDYLSLLAARRFNRFNLAFGLGYDSTAYLRETYFHFAYPFFVTISGYGVSVSNMTDTEASRNLEMLRFISDEAAERGLGFNLGLWTHAYQWIDSPNANHVIWGLTPKSHAPYCRDALARILKECPNISGVTFRIDGESGVPEGSYDFWKTVFDGCVQSGRRVEIDLHATGIDQPMIDVALGTGLPVSISPKFWAEHLGLPYHQAAIRPTELPSRDNDSGSAEPGAGSRSFLRYGYGDLLNEEHRYEIVHRVWPGTQRVLLWGDPVFATAYGRAFGFCGSRGGEIFDPLSFKGRKGSGSLGSRDGYADPSLRPIGGDFTKYSYTYRIWGRLLFNPDTAPEVWQRQLRHDHGPAAEAAERALGHASRILPLVTTAHSPSAANASYWPEMYVNMSIVDGLSPDPYTDTPEPKRFGTVSPLDPQLFAGIDDHADELLAGRVGGKYSPVEVAQWLEDLARTASENLAQATAKTRDRHASLFRRFAIDTNVQIGLGLFFSEKLRAAVLYALYRRTGAPAALEAALRTYRAARETWTRIIELTAKAYVPDLTYGDEWFQRGHWSDRLAAIDQDIAAMERNAAPPASAPAVPPRKVAAYISAVLGCPPRPVGKVTHTPPASFRRRQLVPLELTPTGDDLGAKAARLYYRHTHQAESWRMAPMRVLPDRAEAVIPADYTDMPYPLQYYFELFNASGRPWLYPGLGPALTDQPYFLLRQESGRT
jgi:hypothetical protein